MADFPLLFNMLSSMLLLVLPLILLVVITSMFWDKWVLYVRTTFINKQETVLLQIVPPREIEKSPKAAELFLTSLHQTGGEGTWYDKYWLGKTRAWFSLEMVSSGGEVRFYIWTRKAFAKNIETQIYGQYPTAEVKEVSDYIHDIDLKSGEYAMWGTQFALTAKDAYPIQTYVDFGLDKESEETMKVDPMTATVEFLGSLKQGESVWIQILVRAHKAEDKNHSKFVIYKPSTWNATQDNWQEDAKREIQEIKEKASPKGEDGKPDVSKAQLSEGDKAKIAALERSVSKYGFDVGIRSIYLAPKDDFDPGNIGGIVGAFKQYGSLNLNGFKPDGTTSVDYPWQDITGKKVKKMKEKMFESYKARGYFHPPHKQKNIFILNTEELATIYHLPGLSVSTPSFKRTSSTKGEPPANLPI